MRLLRFGSASLVLGLALGSSACGIYRADASGGGAELSPAGASVSRPKVAVGFTATGQTNAAVQSYATLSSATYGGAALAAGQDQDAAVRRVLFPAIARGQSLDIVFVVDTTASMGWALDSVKAELHQVVSTLASTNPDTRFGIVAFRDRGDSFVSQVGFNLDKDQRSVHAAIDWLSPNGGGDYPEHVYAGVRQGIRGAGTWRPNAAHHVVLIGDAPAHDDYQEPGFTRENIIAEARERQVHIDTVAIACAFVCQKELGI